ncbi:MAG: hypothetical protein ACRDVM_08440, partial [Acidimicrobiia bacterium]
MRAARSRILALLILALLIPGAGTPARAEWPLDFNSPATLRREPRVLVLEGHTTFWRYLPPSVKEAGLSYLELEGVELARVERSAPVPVGRLVLPGGWRRATADSWSVPLKGASWSSVAWELDGGPWTEDARLLQASLRIRLAPGARISSLGMEFAGAAGERLAWESLDAVALGSAHQQVLDLRVVHSSLPDQVRSVSLWFRGRGVVEIEGAEFRAYLLDSLVLQCGEGESRQLPVPGLVGAEDLFQQTSGVAEARWSNPSELRLQLGAESGWQGVSVA